MVFKYVTVLVIYGNRRHGNHTTILDITFILMRSLTTLIKALISTWVTVNILGFKTYVSYNMFYHTNIHVSTHTYISTDGLRTWVDVAGFIITFFRKNL